MGNFDIKALGNLGAISSSWGASPLRRGESVEAGAVESVGAERKPNYFAVNGQMSCYKNGLGHSAFTKDFMA